MKAKVFVTLKRTVLDPQGAAVLSALDALGYKAVKDVRVGKYLELSLESSDRHQAEREVQEMCGKLLANPVIEEFSYTIE